MQTHNQRRRDRIQRDLPALGAVPQSAAARHEREKFWEDKEYDCRRPSHSARSATAFPNPTLRLLLAPGSDLDRPCYPNEHEAEVVANAVIAELPASNRQRRRHPRALRSHWRPATPSSLRSRPPYVLGTGQPLTLEKRTSPSSRRRPRIPTIFGENHPALASSLAKGGRQRAFVWWTKRGQSFSHRSAHQSVEPTPRTRNEHATGRPSGRVTCVGTGSSR